MDAAEFIANVVNKQPSLVDNPDAWKPDFTKSTIDSAGNVDTTAAWDNMPGDYKGFETFVVQNDEDMAPWEDDGIPTPPPEWRIPDIHVEGGQWIQEKTPAPAVVIPQPAVITPTIPIPAVVTPDSVSTITPTAGIGDLFQGKETRAARNRAAGEKTRGALE